MNKRIRWIIIAVSLFMIVSLSRSVVDLWQRKTIVQDEKQRLNQIEQKHEELTKKLDTVQTTTFIEQEARERLGMAKEGETIILMGMTDDGQNQFGSGQKDKNVPNPMVLNEPNWKRWWRVFF